MGPDFHLCECVSPHKGHSGLGNSLGHNMCLRIYAIVNQYISDFVLMFSKTLLVRPKINSRGPL